MENAYTDRDGDTWEFIGGDRYRLTQSQESPEGIGVEVTLENLRIAWGPLTPEADTPVTRAELAQALADLEERLSAKPPQAQTPPDYTDSEGDTWTHISGNTYRLTKSAQTPGMVGRTGTIEQTSAQRGPLTAAAPEALMDVYNSTWTLTALGTYRLDKSQFSRAVGMVMSREELDARCGPLKAAGGEAP